MASDDLLSSRKSDHLINTMKSQTLASSVDSRFNYRPLLGAHPSSDAPYSTCEFELAGKIMRNPIWISSMTGGTGKARHINQNLARACSEFSLGMGLGSCRSLLESSEFFEDFNLRKVIGDSAPLFANLGIAQLETMILNNSESKILELVKRLDADGVIIHVNPMQEWFQPEGDRLTHTPIEIIERFLNKFHLPVIVKEVGQGMDKDSLRALMKLPLEAIDFAAFGGTNFSKIESLRDKNGHCADSFMPFMFVGHSAEEMVDAVNELLAELDREALCQKFIISGGVASSIDGYYLTSKCHGNSVYGQAKRMLEHAQGDYDTLKQFIQNEIRALQLAQNFLTVKS